jgi:hypothetical protein
MTSNNLARFEVGKTYNCLLMNGADSATWEVVGRSDDFVTVNGNTGSTCRKKIRTYGNGNEYIQLDFGYVLCAEDKVEEVA